MSPSSPDARFLSTAEGLGASLVRDALWDGERCNWLGAAYEEVMGRWLTVHRTLGPDLYGGTSGIALFLNQLYRATGNPHHLRTAQGAVAQAYDRRDDLLPEHSLGFYSGYAGIAWACIEVGDTRDDRVWIDRGLRLLAEHAADQPPGGRSLDVVSGAAGVIPALLSCARRFDRDDLLERAIDLGDRLIGAARSSPRGWSWNTVGAPEELGRPDLTGLSHGAAGIAWALLELWAETRESRFLAAAREGLRYEESHFDPAQENWPDFRDAPSAASAAAAPRCASVWCHGAPGIGLTRLRAFELLGETPLRQQAEAALRATYRAAAALAPEQVSLCLCHGLGGNAELFLAGAEVLELAECRSAAERIGMVGIELFDEPGRSWTSGVPGGAQTPNLLLGTAGIGYFYLRLHDPTATPSILLPCIGSARRALAGKTILEEAR